MKDVLSRLINARFKQDPGPEDWLQITEYDEDYRSPCLVGEPDGDGMIRWRPTVCEDDFDWNIDLSAELRDFYTAYYCGESEYLTPWGNVMLILYWNREEREARLPQLLANGEKTNRFMVAHYMDDRFWSVGGDGGLVYLEEPGREAEVKFPSLTAFLSSLQDLSS